MTRCKRILHKPAAGSGGWGRTRQQPPRRAKCSNIPEDSQESSQIDCKLPDELLAEIFKHLSPSDLVRGPASVSSRWQRCSLQPSVWLTKFSLPKPATDLPGFSSGRFLPRLYRALHADNLLCNFGDSGSAYKGTQTGSQGTQTVPCVAIRSAMPSHVQFRMITIVCRNTSNISGFELHLEHNWVNPQHDKCIPKTRVNSVVCADAWLPWHGSDWQREHDCGNGMPPEDWPTELGPSDEVLASSYMNCSIHTVHL